MGELARYSWRSVLPYTLTFDSRVTRVEPPHLIEGHAIGELEGVGVWRLFAAPDSTAVLYSWQVRTTKRWMNVWGPAARPAFRWNHDRVMYHGGVGLAERLGASLLLHEQSARAGAARRGGFSERQTSARSGGRRSL